MSQSQWYQTVYIRPNKLKTSKCHNPNVKTVYTHLNKHTTSKCHNYNVIKEFIRSQTNTRQANVTITMLSNNLYPAKKTHDQHMSQSLCYQTIYMQPNKHTTSKCHNHNVSKPFIRSQTNTPANFTIIML